MSHTYAELLETAVAIELECAALYEVFAKAFAAHPDQVYFWKLYAEAERYHAASIRIHQVALYSNAAEAAAPAGAELDDARTFLGELRATREGFERNGVSIREALEAARRTEDHSAELHGRVQFFRSMPEFDDLFRKMAEEDKAHRDVLASAEARWGGRP